MRSSNSITQQMIKKINTLPFVVRQFCEVVMGNQYSVQKKDDTHYTLFHDSSGVEVRGFSLVTDDQEHFDVVVDGNNCNISFVRCFFESGLFVGDTANIFAQFSGVQNKILLHHQNVGDIVCRLEKHDISVIADRCYQDFGDVSGQFCVLDITKKIGIICEWTNVGDEIVLKILDAISRTPATHIADMTTGVIIDRVRVHNDSSMSSDSILAMFADDLMNEFVYDSNSEDKKDIYVVE